MWKQVRKQEGGVSPISPTHLSPCCLHIWGVHCINLVENWNFGWFWWWFSLLCQILVLSQNLRGKTIKGISQEGDRGYRLMKFFFHKVLTFFEGWHCIVEFEVFVGKKINILEKIDWYWIEIAILLGTQPPWQVWVAAISLQPCKGGQALPTTLSQLWGAKPYQFHQITRSSFLKNR